MKEQPGKGLRPEFVGAFEDSKEIMELRQREQGGGEEEARGHGMGLSK